jgi:hypothetical protein
MADDCEIRRVVPDAAREPASRLAAIFWADAETTRQLNDAHGRLRDANQQLWSGLAPEAVGLIYDRAVPAGKSEIATLAGDTRSAGGCGRQVVLLQALQRVHWKIHRAVCDYQNASEQRRQYAVEVGELSAQLTAALCAAGWSAQQARRADVHALAAGELLPAKSSKPNVPRRTQPALVALSSRWR